MPGSKAPLLTRCAECVAVGCPAKPRGEFDHPDIAFVGEALGAEEEREGLPFVGRSGKLLRQTADSAGLDLSKIYYTNAVMWRPEGNRTPKAKEILACNDRLLDELVRVRPRLIMPVGGVGAYALLGEDVGIMKRRGVYREIEVDGIKMGVLPSIHPASIFRQPDFFLFLYEDMLKAKSILDGHAPVEEPCYDKYLIIDNQDMFEALLRRLRQQKIVSIDIETTDLDPQKGEILCVGFSWQRGTAAVLDWQELIQYKPDNLEALRETLLNVPASFQGGQFDNPWLWHEGIDPLWTFDTMAAHYTVNEIQGSHGLKRQAIDRYYAPAYDDDLKEMLRDAKKEGLIPGGKRRRKDPEAEEDESETKATEGDDRKGSLKIPIEAWSVPAIRTKILKYCGADVDYTQRLTEDLPVEMQADSVTGVFDDVILPALKHFAWLESVGIKVDTDYHDSLGAGWQAEQDQVCERLYEMSDSYDWPTTPSGRPWWSSRVRLERYLFGDLGLRKMVSTRRDGKLSQDEVLEEIQSLEEPDEDAVDYWRTASSAVFSNMKPNSTNTYMLHWLAQQHDFPRAMVDWRILDKKLGTYYHGYRAIMRQGGRIHPRYRVTGARTMRVSCTDPNIHGVARKKEIKRIFVADPGFLLLYSDYSQAEIRMLAHMSGDEQLRQACEAEDIHFAIACDLFQLTADQMRAIDAERREFMRRAAKTIAFGIIYGRMPASLAPQLGCTVEEATVYRERFLARMKDASRWISTQKQIGMQRREVVNLYGGKRRFPVILDKAHQSDVERQIVNTPIQGSVSLMTLIANMKIIEELQRRDINVYPWPHIHDGFMVQVERGRIKEAQIIAQDILHTPGFPTRVRFAIEMQIGPSWAELETVHKG